MSSIMETVRGTPYAMGYQHGQAFRHVIHATVANYTRHDYEKPDPDWMRRTQAMREFSRLYLPWLDDELRGIADASGITCEKIEKLHYFLPDWAGACTAIGMVTPDAGLVLGANLDDSRTPNVLIRRVPDHGIPHVCITWAGTGWAGNGMNAAGLAIVGSSLGGYGPALRWDPGPRLLAAILTRLVLQTCHTVREAVDVIKEMPTETNLVIGDAGGDLIACQLLGRYRAFERPAQGMVFCTNHIFMPELVQALAAHGITPEIPDHTRIRFETLRRARTGKRRASSCLRQLLCSHRAYPHSICRDGTALSVIAMPQQSPPAWLCADAHPCRNAYVRYPVADTEADDGADITG